MKRWRWLVVVMFSVLGAVAHAAPFYASKDGSTVWDEATGLVWARCNLGQKWTGKTCVGDASQHGFDDAQAAAKRFNAAGGLGGATDWMVPAIRQLVSLRSCSTGLISDLRNLQDNGEQVQKSCADKPVQPTIDAIAFPGTPADWYWSSSAASGERAWCVDLNDGSANDLSRSRGLQCAVRVVRAGQLLGGEAALAFRQKLPAVATPADWARYLHAEKEAVEAAEKERRAATEAAEKAANAAALK